MSVPDSTPDYLSAAIGYTRQGWRVLPLLSGSKRPALTRWPELATTDARQVADWWIDQPDRNIGLATGAASGFFVLDIDPKNGGDVALDALEQEHGALPNTYSVHTGSGGTHYYFAIPDFEVTNSPGALKGSGIDVRGEGGQVVAPPSATSAGVYVRRSAAGAILPAPTWLLELIRPRPLALVPASDRIDVDDRPRLEQYVGRAVDAACMTVASASGGSRNQTLNDQVLGLAGIAAHDPDLVPKADLYNAMHAACGLNGYLNDDGVGAFTATFESAWKAGLVRPRREWPPADKNAGLDFGTAPARRAAMPTVNISQRKFDELTDEVVANLVRSNDADPKIFVHGDELVEIIGPPPRTIALSPEVLSYRADQVMHFEKQQPRGGTAVANLPTKIADVILKLSQQPFPELDRISLTPFFAPSGRYVDAYGYDAESHTFHSPSLSMTPLPVPDLPSAEEVSAALSFIRREVLHDFPFVSDADRAHAVALMLLPFVRDLIDGPTPLHNIEAPTPGSGKGLLTRCLLMPGVGGRPSTITAPVGEEEWQKALFSHLRQSPQVVVVDNVNARLSSGSLCMALTEPEFSSRVLGVSEAINVPVSTVWAMTANNPKFSDEVARRTIRIRVDAQVERPEDRGGFRHADLGAWCAAHRAELVQTCCTMVQGWVKAGMPEVVPVKPLGSFEHWHAVMGGLLDYLGVPGLLENKAEFLAAGDDEADAWTHLIAYMRTDLAAEWTSGHLAEVVTEQGIAIDLGRGENKALMMGRELAKQRDRWHGGYQIAKRMVNGKSWWKLVGLPDL